ncbi:hypothetical protein OM428_04035 [Enterococcus gallinarum]|nr:hypothetical protein [Enterococcus gallinarum]MCW3744365.1 hypothetical protein [Enterococcus gallinarum]
MRFLHSADLHIDRSFEGIRMLSDNVKEQLPLINRKIIKNWLIRHWSMKWILFSWRGYLPPSPSKSADPA